MGRAAGTLTGAAGYPSEEMNEIWVDQFDQTLVIETDFGLYQYEDFFNRWYPISELPVIDNDTRQLRAPDILVPEFDANYMGRGEFIDFYGRSFVVTAVLDDGTGDLWIGTWGLGPAMADAASGLMKLLPYGLVQRRVDVILADDSALWTGGAGDSDFRTGLTAYYPETNRFFRLESGVSLDLPVEDIFSLEVDSSRLYVGTPMGLYQIDKADWVAQGPIDFRRGLPEDFVLSLEKAGDRLFVGTTGGLAMIHPGTDSVFHVRPETFHQQYIYDLEQVANTIWIASSAGAFRYSYETDRLQQFEDPDIVLFGSVLDVEHYDDQVWFASDAGAVTLNLQTGETESFHEPTSLRDRRALAVNDRMVALAADIGLTIVFFHGDKSYRRRFTAADGLASDYVLSLALDGDYLWVGTDRGLTRFLWNNPNWVD